MDANGVAEEEAKVQLATRSCRMPGRQSSSGILPGRWSAPIPRGPLQRIRYNSTGTVHNLTVLRSGTVTDEMMQQCRMANL